MSAIVDYQIASQSESLPSETDLKTWITAVLQSQGVDQKEVTVRVVDEDESRDLNLTYRGKDKPTNVLSFPFEAPKGIDIPLLGDLVVCAPVVATEAQEQNKPLMHHWAHMIVHGTLHLMGFDHIDDEDADQMESLEKQILSQFSIDDPYQDH